MSKRSLHRLSHVSAAAIVLALAGQALALESEDIIKYRQAVMKSQAGHMGALAQIVRGKVDFKADMSYHAQALAASMKTVIGLFPDGSDFGVTSALPSVWEKRAGFETSARDAEAAADEFLKAVESGDEAAIGAKFMAVSDSCKACHKDFREEKE